MPVSFRDPILLFNHYPRTLINLMRENGASEDALLLGTDITPSLYQDLDSTISYSQYARLIFNALASYQDPGLGLVFGQALNIAQHGMLGVAVMTSKTLEEALFVLQENYKLLSPVLVIELRRSGSEAIVQANSAWQLGPLHPLAVECLLGGLYNNCKFVLGLNRFPCNIRFAYPEPTYSDRYASYFENPVAFDCVADQIVFDANLLSQPLVYHNEVTQQIALAQCHQQLAVLQERESLVLKLRRLPILTDDRVLSLDQAASELYLSGRSLRRHLKTLGVSYQQLLDRIRSERAIELLKQPDLSVVDIATRLHFGDAANFRKAFKRWLGTTPQAYRRSLIEGGILGGNEKSL